MSWGTNWLQLQQLAREGVAMMGANTREEGVAKTMHGMTEGEAVWHKRYIQVLADLNIVRETLDALGVPKGKVPYVLQSDEGPDVDLSWRPAWLLGRQAGRVAQEERVWVNGGRVLGLSDVRDAQATAAINEGEAVVNADAARSLGREVVAALNGGLARQGDAAHWEKVAATALLDLKAEQEAHRRALQVANRQEDVLYDLLARVEEVPPYVREFIEDTKTDHPDVVAAMEQERSLRSQEAALRASRYSASPWPTVDEDKQARMVAALGREGWLDEPPSAEVYDPNAYPEPFDESGPLDDPGVG